MQRLLAALVLLASSCVSQHADGVGPHAAFELRIGTHELSGTEDEAGNVVYTESIIYPSTVLFSAGYGMRKGRLWLEPSVYAGSGSGRIDGGKLFGALDARYEDWNGSALGAGVRSRAAIVSNTRFGLDVKYVSWTGESEFKVDGFPGLDTVVDIKTDELDLVLVVDYDGMRFRPYFACGLLFRSVQSTDTAGGDVFEAVSREPLGCRLGLDIKTLFASALDAAVELGYFGGLDLRLSLAYRF